MPPTKQEPSSRQSSGWYAYSLPGLSGRGYENTLMEWMSLSWLWNQCCFPAVFCYCFFFQDSSLIKIKIWSRNLGPGELFISLHSYKGILLFPAFLLKDTECKSLSRVWLFETLRTVVPRLLCPWNSPGQNTGVGSWLPSLGDLPDPGIEVSCIAGRFFTSCDSKSPSQHWKMHQPASSP